MRNWIIVTTVLVGCPTGTEDKTGESADSGTTPTGTPPTEVTGGFDITGQVLNLADPSTAAPAGLCIALLDPQPAIAGKPPEVIAGPVELGKGGTFGFEDVFPPSTIGLLLTVDDCNKEPVDCVKGSKDGYFTAATGIQGSSFIGLTKDDVLSTAAFAIDCGTLDGFELSGNHLYKPTKKQAGDLSTDGFIVGFVWDESNVPIENAVITGGGTVLYADGDKSDGLFTTAENANLATSLGGGGMFLAPGAGIGSYVADDAGVHEFTAQLGGSSPGSAFATVFFGTTPKP